MCTYCEEFEKVFAEWKKEFQSFMKWSDDDMAMMPEVYFLTSALKADLNWLKEVNSRK